MAAADHWTRFLEVGDHQYPFKYLVHFVNKTGQLVLANLSPSSIPDSDNNSNSNSNNKLIGIIGYPLDNGKKTSVPIPDFTWSGWGGPFRIALHLQDHPLTVSFTVDPEKSQLSHLKETKVTAKPGTVITLTNHDVSQVESPSQSSEWQSFWTELQYSEISAPNLYHFKYAILVQNETETLLRANVSVPSGGVSTGYQGYPVQPKSNTYIPIPDFRWWGWGGPHRIQLHIQDHPIKVSLCSDQESNADLHQLLNNKGEIEVKPGSTLIVTDSRVDVQHA